MMWWHGRKQATENTLQTSISILKIMKTNQPRAWKEFANE